MSKGRFDMRKSAQLSLAHWLAIQGLSEQLHAQHPWQREGSPQMGRERREKQLAQMMPSHH